MKTTPGKTIGHVEHAGTRIKDSVLIEKLGNVKSHWQIKLRRKMIVWEKGFRLGSKGRMYQVDDWLLQIQVFFSSQ
jgi:hypothetical protein